MNATAVRANRQKLAVLAALVLLCAAGYMLVGVHFDNAKSTLCLVFLNRKL